MGSKLVIKLHRASEKKINLICPIHLAAFTVMHFYCVLWGNVQLIFLWKCLILVVLNIIIIFLNRNVLYLVSCMVMTQVLNAVLIVNRFMHCCYIFKTVCIWIITWWSMDFQYKCISVNVIFIFIKLDFYLYFLWQACHRCRSASFKPRIFF